MTPIHDFAPDLRLVLTPNSRLARGYGPLQQAVMSRSDLDDARRWATSLDVYAPTPLVSLPMLAHRLHLAQLHIKHEGHRFGVGSFKALGPPYALARLLDDAQSPITVCAATSGNHGRALAWAAQREKCACIIYMPEMTSQNREEAIRKYGATVVRVPGNYDNSVLRAQADAEREGMILVGETASSGYPNVPRHILHGYSVLGQELIDTSEPTHIFIAAGGGNLAAAIVGAWWLRKGEQRPRCVIVSPHQADSPLHSVASGRRTPAQGDLTTLMDGLSVGQVSEVAWPMLDGGAAAMITISDAIAIEGLRLLALPCAPDPRVELGETGIAAFAGLVAVCAQPQAREMLGLSEESRVIVIGCEGVTDATIYRGLVDDSTTG